MTEVDSSISHSDQEIAFPVLTKAQIEALQPYGSCSRIPAGQPVWEVGAPDACMHVVMSGELEIIDPVSQRTIAVHNVGSFSGDVDVITGRPTLVAGIAKTDLGLISIPGEHVRTIVGQLPELGDIILRALMLRRNMLQQSGKLGILVVGSRYNAETTRIREFLHRSRYPVTWDDVESSASAQKFLDELGICVEDTPVVVIPRGDVLRRPSVEALGEALGIRTEIHDVTADVVIIGAGPAGLAAAVYGASEGLKTILVDAEAPGGQAGTSSRIENYMGFPLGISGQELADGAIVQAEKFGAQLIAPARVSKLSCADAGYHSVEIDGVGTVLSRCVVLATGANYSRLEVDRFSEFENRGIYFAATNVERLLCAQSEVAVVGAGNSAGQAAVYMTETCKHVYLVVRGDDLRKSMSSYLANRIETLAKSGKLSILLNSSVCQLEGDQSLTSVTIRDATTGVARKEPIEAIFVMIGASPCTDWLKDNSKVALDAKGFVLAGSAVVSAGQWKLSRPPFPLETSCPGVFVVGDVRSGSVKRVASAVGEGSMAIALAHQYMALS